MDDGGPGSVEVSQHADAAAKADALSHPKLMLTVALQRLVYVSPSSG
jgi:hypothetical protein